MNTEIWTYSPHAIRWESNDKNKPEQACYWCPNMMEVKDSKLTVHSRYESNHKCDGDCPAKGRFTSGIETREIDAGDGYGPHGQKIGQFDDTKAADDFEVEYIKVYQNSNYEQYIQDDSEFKGSVDLD